MSYTYADIPPAFLVYSSLLITTAGHGLVRPGLLSELRPMGMLLLWHTAPSKVMGCQNLFPFISIFSISMPFHIKQVHAPRSHWAIGNMVRGSRLYIFLDIYIITCCIKLNHDEIWSFSEVIWRFTHKMIISFSGNYCQVTRAPWMYTVVLSQTTLL